MRDAEVVRKTLVDPNNMGLRWSLLGQSFGGFCAVTYLSIAPHGASASHHGPPSPTLTC